MKTRAFTLLEALIVILIIGTVVVIFSQEYQMMVWRVRWSEALVTMSAIRQAQIFHYNEHNDYAGGIPDAITGHDYADSAEDVNLWFKNHNMDIIEVQEGAFKFFNYDVHISPAGKHHSVMAVRNDKDNPDPNPQENYGIKLDFHSGKLKYNPNHYP